jgi:hypothetical protein
MSMAAVTVMMLVRRLKAGVRVDQCLDSLCIYVGRLSRSRAARHRRPQHRRAASRPHAARRLHRSARVPSDCCGCRATIRPPGLFLLF